MLTGDLNQRITTLSKIAIQNSGSLVNSTHKLNFTTNTANLSLITTDDSQNSSVNVWIDLQYQYGSAIKTENFTATANQTSFSLNNNSIPANSAYLIVNLNGLVQIPGTHYTLSGNNLTFTSNCTTGDLIEVREFISMNLVACTSIVSERFTATTNQSSFSLTTNNLPTDPNYLLVNRNGITQAPGVHYTLAGNTVTFTSNCNNGDVVEVREFVAVSSITPGGSNTQILFNDGNGLANGSANLTFNKANNALAVTGNIILNGSLLYDTGTFVANSVGMNPLVQITVYYTRVRDQVTLFIPGFSGTSNATNFQITGLPASLTPIRGQGNIVIPVIDNGGAVVSGVSVVCANGTVTFYKSLTSAGNDWTASGTKLAGAHNPSYLLT